MTRKVTSVRLSPELEEELKKMMMDKKYENKSQAMRALLRRETKSEEGCE